MRNGKLNQVLLGHNMNIVFTKKNASVSYYRSCNSRILKAPLVYNSYLLEPFKNIMKLLPVSPHVYLLFKLQRGEVQDVPQYVNKCFKVTLLILSVRGLYRRCRRRKYRLDSFILSADVQMWDPTSKKRTVHLDPLRCGLDCTYILLGT